MSNSPSTEHRYDRRLVRYGVPAVVLIFYLSAAQKFQYTPDSTYAALASVRDSQPESLWSVLLMLANTAGIDVLLAAKIFSLFFTCSALLLSYLIAHEVLRDHITAFCVMLSVAMQSWLLQIAPAGSGVGFGMFLIVSSIFFLLRNEYILSTLFAGLASLVMWQGTGLLVVIVIDAFFNSISAARYSKIMGSAVLIFVAVVLPWVLYSAYVGKIFLPDILGGSDVPTLLLPLAFEAVLLVGLMFIGIVMLALRERETLRSLSAGILWVVIASFSDQRMLVLSLPLVITFAFLGATRIAITLGIGKFSNLVVVVLTVCVLAYNQFVVIPPTHTIVDEHIAQTAGLMPIASWLKVNVKEDETIAVPVGHERFMAFASEKRLMAGNAEFLVADADSHARYEKVYDPTAFDAELLTKTAYRYTIWRRK